MVRAVVTPVLVAADIRETIESAQPYIGRIGPVVILSRLAADFPEWRYTFFLNCNRLQLIKSWRMQR